MHGLRTERKVWGQELAQQGKVLTFAEKLAVFLSEQIMHRREGGRGHVHRNWCLGTGECVTHWGTGGCLPVWPVAFLTSCAGPYGPYGPYRPYGPYGAALKEWLKALLP